MIEAEIQRLRLLLPEWSRHSSIQMLEWIDHFAELWVSERKEILSVLRQEYRWTDADLEREWGRSLQVLSEVRNRLTKEVFGNPWGVLAVITPYFSPLSSALESVLCGLISQNAVIWKSSERAPRITKKIAELIQVSGRVLGQGNLPLVFLSGDRDLGRRLSLAPGIDALWFTGTFETGIRIKQETLAQNGKALCLALGSRNIGYLSAEAWRERPQQVLGQILESAWGFAGQDVRSLHRLIVDPEIVSDFTRQVLEAAKSISVSSMIDSGILDRALKFLGVGAKEGIEWVLRGKVTSLEHPLNLSPSVGLLSGATIDTVRRSVFLQSDFSAPLLMLIHLAPGEDLVSHLEASSYGYLGAAWLAQGEKLPIHLQALKVGEFVFNQSTLKMDYSRIRIGLKRSGNSTHLGCGDPRWGRR